MSQESSPHAVRSWTTADFGDLFENVTSSKLKLARKSYSPEGAFPVVDQGEEYVGGYSDDENLVHPGPLPVVIFGDHTRCVKFCDRRFIQGADGVKVLAPSAAVDPMFGYWALKAADIPSKGYARHFDLLRKTRFPVAPLPEQTRIVEAIESYFTRLDNAVATLGRVQANLKRYRASVLKAAVEGRLVPAEAELARREGRDYEPASVLLERILAERRRRWEEAELDALKARGKAPKDDKWKANYKEPVAPNTSELPELPEGWCWATMGQLCRVQGGFAFKSIDYQETGSPLIRISNISEGVAQVLPGNPRIPDRIASNMSGFYVKGGDILIAMSGATTGKLGRYTGSEIALLNQRVGRFLPQAPDLLVPDYTFLLASTIGSNALSRAYGAAQPNISPREIEETPVPLAPRLEQMRVAAATARYTSIADNIEASLDATAARSKQTRQSILKWAFEGKLADQDPNDEPASLLLERIKAEREATPTDGKTKTRKKRNGRKRSAA